MSPCFRPLAMAFRFPGACSPLSRQMEHRYPLFLPSFSYFLPLHSCFSSFVFFRSPRPLFLCCHVSIFLLHAFLPFLIRRSLSLGSVLSLREAIVTIVCREMTLAEVRPHPLEVSHCLSHRNWTGRSAQRQCLSDFQPGSIHLQAASPDRRIVLAFFCSLSRSIVYRAFLTVSVSLI